MWQYQKCKAKQIATTVVSAALMLAGCVTTPDGRMTIDPKIACAASILGGTVIGAAAGGGKGAAIGGGAGLAVCGTTWLIAQYLNEQEQQSLTQTQTRMLETSSRKTVRERWQNPDGSKSVDLIVEPERLVKVSSVSFKTQNTGSLSKVPADAMCRPATKKLGNGSSINVLNCRTAEGDWVEVGETVRL